LSPAREQNSAYDHARWADPQGSALFYVGVAIAKQSAAQELARDCTKWRAGKIIERKLLITRQHWLNSFTTMIPIVKTNSLQSYTMLLYRKAIHPEFFAIEGRRRIENGTIEAEAWIFRGGQAIRFQQDKLCLCEIVTDHPHALPERGLSVNVPCAGEHEHEESLSEELKFMTAVQTETLAEHLYIGTYKEMVTHARDNESLVCDWKDPASGKPNLSVVDLQRYRTEIHVQGWHLRSDCGLVLRTQSMFQLTEVAPKTPLRKAK